MGQYYYVVNTTKKQFLHPHKFGDGLKLLEFGPSQCGTMCGLAILLANGNGRGGGDLHSNNPIIGSWAGDSIVIAGDYADEGDFVTDEDFAKYTVAVREDEAKERAENGDTEGEEVTEEVDKPNLYHLARVYEDISYKVIEALCDDGYILEHLAEPYRDFGQRDMPEPLRQRLIEAKRAANPEREGKHLRPDMVISIPIPKE
jgi:hypothetical protein